MGEWTVRPVEGMLEGEAGEHHLQPKSMDVLLCLAQAASDIVERDALIAEVWGQTAVSDEPLTRCIHDIRRELGDTRDKPTYIQTIPKRGYRLITPVEALDDGVAANARGTSGRRAVLRAFKSRRGMTVVAAAAALVASVVAASIFLRPFDPVATLPVAGAKSLAVLPFDTGTDADAAEWLGDGLAEDLLIRLAEVDGIVVASRAASFREFPPATDVVEIGHELNVHYVLKGSVERSDGRLRVVARLIDAQTRHRLWSQSFERPSGEWFALQEGIATQVANALLPSGADEAWPALPAVDAVRVAVAPTSSIEAYDHHLRARNILQSARDAETLDAAAEQFAQAIQLDSGFAKAYAGLCQTFVLRLELRPDPQFAEAATEVCRRGLALHPDSIDARLAWADMARVGGDPKLAIADYRQVIDSRPRAVDAWVGMARAHADLGDATAAERAFRLAIELQPDHDPAYRAFGEFLFANGRYGEAFDVGRRQVQLDPDSVTGYKTLGDASFNVGRFTAAIAAYREVIARDASADAYRAMGASLYYLGRYSDAIKLYREAAELAPGDHRIWVGIGDAYTQVVGDGAQAEDAYRIARELVEEKLTLTPNDPVLRVWLAYYCAAVGDKACAWRHSGDAVALAPELAAVHYVDALVNLRFDKEAAAIAAVERTLQLGYPRALLAADPQLAVVRDNPRLSGLFLARQTLAQLAP